MRVTVAEGLDGEDTEGLLDLQAELLDAQEQKADQACGGHGGEVVRLGLGSGPEQAYPYPYPHPSPAAGTVARWFHEESADQMASGRRPSQKPT